MASITQVTVTCDFHDNAEVTAVETINIGWDGKDLEADYCAAHAEALRGALGPYVAKARKVTARPPRGGQRDRKTGPMIRAWARGQGIPVSGSGRIPASVTARFKAEHS